MLLDQENFTFPGFNDLKSFATPLEEKSEDSRFIVPSLCGLGFVSPVKDFKDKGHFLRSCVKAGESGVLKKIQPGFMMGDFDRATLCPLEKDITVHLENHIGALRAVKAPTRVSQ